MGRITTKLNLFLSDEWIPLRFTLTAGQGNDRTQASELIKGYAYQYLIGNSDHSRERFNIVSYKPDYITS